MSLRHRHKRRQMEARRIAEEVAQRLNPQPIDNLARIEQHILRNLSAKRAALDDHLEAQRYAYELLAKPQSKTQVPQGHGPKTRGLTTGRR